MTEEERAALYRKQFAARRQERREQYTELAGDRDARVALDLSWRPVLLTQLEAQAPADDDCFDALEELYVEVPERDIYLTEIPDSLLV